MTSAMNGRDCFCWLTREGRFYGSEPQKPNGYTTTPPSAEMEILTAVSVLPLPPTRATVSVSVSGVRIVHTLVSRQQPLSGANNLS